MSQSFVESLGWVPKSRNLATTLARACDMATAQSHRFVTLEHLLLALIADSDASAVLQACQVNLGQLNAEITGYVGSMEDRLPPGMASEPTASPDVIRILEYAAAAAQQSRRRDVNGAIVLAAIVGDGRSSAAGMLRAQGLTFEEAVKALQRSNAAPRNAPQPAPAQPAPAAPSPQPQAARPQQPHPAPQPDPTWQGGQSGEFPQRVNGGLPTSATEEILARARRRVETGRRPEPPEQEVGPAPDAYALDPRDAGNYAPEPYPAPAPDPAPMNGAHADPHLPYEEDISHRQPPYPPEPESLAPEPPQPMPPPPPDNPTPASGWGGRPPAPRPQPTIHPHVGFPRPQPPPAPYPGEPQRSAPPPWSSPHAEADIAPAGPAGGLRRGRSSADGRPNTAVAAGQLVENIPRTMRAGRQIMVEARIAKADVSALAEGLQGSGTAYRHDLVVTKAMSVRLRAPDGGFWIETASPETQWIENTLGTLSDDFASWRWNVTPQQSGKARLQLVVSARTVGTDGLAAETALPDRYINVKIRINYGRTLSQWSGWIVAAMIGGILARFGENVWDFVQAIIGGQG